MKKLILISACALFAFCTSAQTDNGSAPSKNGSNYCVSIFKGKIIVTRDGKLISLSVKLYSGATLTADGKIIRKDKSHIELKPGECIDMNGIIFSDAIAIDEQYTEELLMFDGHGYKLPEVEVAGNKIQSDKIISYDKKTTVQEQISSSFEFRDYLQKIKLQIADNERCIAVIRIKISSDKKEGYKKQMRKINSLEIENCELNNELVNFVCNGIGNWRIFRKEFNYDLAILGHDLTNMEFTLEDFLASNTNK